MLLVFDQKESFTGSILRQYAQGKSKLQNNATCSPTNCIKSNRTNLTTQCSHLNDATTCNKSYLFMEDGMIPCSWIDGVYDPVNKTCGKNPNSAGGTCGTCF